MLAINQQNKRVYIGSHYMDCTIVQLRMSNTTTAEVTNAVDSQSVNCWYHVSLHLSVGVAVILTRDRPFLGRSEIISPVCT